ncbi:hypothetical protein, partial [Hyella patelloides]|uniref:hypothetical protein n=1 Tax=Hyella patelloides TaxID=1982969 RepID=UPI001C95065D
WGQLEQDVGNAVARSFVCVIIRIKNLFVRRAVVIGCSPFYLFVGVRSQSKRLERKIASWRLTRS